MNDPHNLQRFVEAQNPVFDTVRSELLNGRKSSHWIWYIFPQIAGLGHSETARKFAISSRAEAEAYLAHPILGPRLQECTELVTQIESRSAREIFGSPDDLKFRSSTTLFAEVAPESGVFKAALQKFYDGKRDSATLEKL